ncbi:hypothetical protein HY357_03680 [Candidatus Roizmanbacteria bacterium]|nr:hypothetical protein [Candidatus Roizmanbacteria bacterium]
MKQQLAKKIFFIIFFTTSAFIIYTLFFEKRAVALFCKLQVETKINNYRRSVKRNGQLIANEDEDYITKLISPMYEECLKKQ